MSTVAEIKAAIDRLSPPERCELEALLHPFLEDDWDHRMTTDAEPGGKLHEMMSESRKSAEVGKLIDFPKSGRNEVESLGEVAAETWDKLGPAPMVLYD